MSYKLWENKWTLGEQLGQGGQGVTYQVTSKATGERGVLKALKNQESAQARGRMIQEVAALSSLSLQGVKVPRVIDDNTKDATSEAPLYFVMELIAGRSLQKEMEIRKRLPLDEAAELFLALADIVSAAHNANVLHRDLKPDNIIVRDFETNDLVVIDFGLAFDQTAEGDLTRATEHLQSKFLALPEANTPGGDRRDARSDITAACAILCYCLTGHKPGQLRDSDGRPVHRTKGHSVRDAFPDERRIEQIEVFFDRALAYEVDNRFQSWAECFGRLRLALANEVFDEDPIVVAKQQAAILNRHDLKTRKISYASACTYALNTVFEVVTQISDQLGKLHEISRNDFEYPMEVPFPEDMDQMSNVKEITIQLLPSRITRVIAYTIGGKGEQCVLLRRVRFFRASGDVQPSHETEWEQRIWFDPVAEVPKATIEKCIRSDIGQAIRGLTEERIALNANTSDRDRSIG